MKNNLCEVSGIPGTIVGYNQKHMVHLMNLNIEGKLGFICDEFFTGNLPTNLKVIFRN